MSKHLRNCIPILEVYVNLKEEKQKKKYLQMFESCILKALREMSINLLQGNVDLSFDEKNKLERYKMALRKLADPQTSPRTSRKLLASKGKELINQILPLVLSTINHG